MGNRKNYANRKSQPHKRFVKTSDGRIVPNRAYREKTKSKQAIDSNADSIMEAVGNTGSSFKYQPPTFADAEYFNANHEIDTVKAEELALQQLAERFEDEYPGYQSALDKPYDERSDSEQEIVDEIERYVETGTNSTSITDGTLTEFGWEAEGSFSAYMMEDDLKIQASELADKAMPGGGYLTLETSQADWTGRPGQKTVSVEDFKKNPVGSIAPNGEFSQQWEFKDDGRIEIIQSQHDIPTGALITVRPSSDDEIDDYLEEHNYSSY